MSIKVTDWVWNHSTHVGTELLLMLAIAQYSQADGSAAYPSVKALAANTRLSARQVRRVLRKLVCSGELEVEPQSGPRKVNGYRIILQPGHPESLPGSPNAGETDDFDVSGDKSEAGNSR